MKTTPENQTADGSPSGAAPCCASLARDAELRRRLLALGSWCISRADGEHDSETTLTMLEKEAASLRDRVMLAYWMEIADMSQKCEFRNTSSERVAADDIFQHNAESIHPETKP